MSAVHAAAPAVTRSAQKLFNHAVATVLRSEYGIGDVSTVWVTDLVKGYARSGDALACARALVEFPAPAAVVVLDAGRPTERVVDPAAREAAANRVIALGRMAIIAREAGLDDAAEAAEGLLDAAVAAYNALA